MIYIVIGAVGFLIIRCFDIVSLKRVPKAKPGIWILGCGLLIYSLTMICFAPGKLLLPMWSTWLGWVLLSVSLFLLIYSLVVNLPFRRTYITTGVGDKLITTGLYALVRHPWVHCFTLLLLSLVLVSKSGLLLIASPVWILLDILLAVVQDKFFFGRMFNDYYNYRRETPMLVPNRRSINAFMNSLRQSRT